VVPTDFFNSLSQDRTFPPGLFAALRGHRKEAPSLSIGVRRRLGRLAGFFEKNGGSPRTLVSATDLDAFRLTGQLGNTR
jgi:hypothetical protein